MKRYDLKLFVNIPTIHSERLTLRRIKPGDLEDVYEYASDSSVSEFLLWSPHPTMGYTKAYLAHLQKRYRACDFYEWGIEFEGKMIGTVGFTSFSIEHNVGEIGYVLSSKYWGMGIGTEAVKRILEFGFEELLLNRIEAKFMAENIKSRTLLEGLGFNYEGNLKEAVYSKGMYRDVGICALTRSEYLRNK